MIHLPQLLEELAKYDSIGLKDRFYISNPAHIGMCAVTYQQSLTNHSHTIINPWRMHRIGFQYLVGLCVSE